MLSRSGRMLGGGCMSPWETVRTHGHMWELDVRHTELSSIGGATGVPKGSGNTQFHSWNTQKKKLPSPGNRL
jgi:hypothetical protein